MRASKLVVPVALVLAAAVASPAWAAPAKVDVVARSLDAPRHLAFGARGDLFVAEAAVTARARASSPARVRCCGSGRARGGAPAPGTRWSRSRRSGSIPAD